MSGTHAYGGDCPGMAGLHHYGGGGLGILGSALATDGYIYPSLSMPADADKEYYGLVTSIPPGLTINIGEAGDFDASAPDGTYVVPWTLYESGAPLGGTSFSLKFGANSTINLAISNLASAGTLSTVAATVTPAVPGVVNLAISNLASAGTLSTVAATVTPAAPTVAVYPAPSDVRAGVTYGPTGADYIGTLLGPTATEIAAAVWSYQTALSIPAFLALK